jgi:hypothetical protein
MAPWSTDRRTSDEERRAISAALRRGYSDGRLSIATLELRLERLTQALSFGEALELASDLPPTLPLRHRLALLAKQTREWLRIPERLERRAELRPASLEPPDHPGRGVMVGRAPDCDVILPDPAVSRHHLFVRRDDEGWRMIDLRSKNGTRLNGVQVRLAHLRDGDLLDLGGTELVFRS